MAKEFFKRLVGRGKNSAPQNEAPHIIAPSVIESSIAMTNEVNSTAVEAGQIDEARKEVYLASLSERDRQNVENFLSVHRRLKEQLGTIDIAITAVGSTSKTESKRHHAPEDIDLRILNSAEIGSEERKEAIEIIRSGIRHYLNEQQINYEENDYTFEQHMVEGFRYDPITFEKNKELMPYADWYNNEPSFEFSYDYGLPLHISISGLDNPPLHEYLQNEQNARTSTVLLETTTR
jgi:hypothetical protein